MRKRRLFALCSNSTMEGSNSEEDKLKGKKSLFSSLITKRKYKSPQLKITEQIRTYSSINFESDSATSEQDTSLSKTNSLPNNVTPNKPLTLCFFQKIIRGSRSSHQETLEEKLTTNSNSDELISDDMGDTSVAHINNFFPTSYSPKYDLKLINGISELQDILQNLNKSEEHVIHLLQNYIENKDFQKQLLKVSFEYFSLQFDTKLQASAVSNDLWLQQLEIAKVQEQNTQKKLNFLVEQNRQFQEQIENLSRHCEKLTSRSKLYPNRFQQIKAFKKMYARHLIENNKKLHNRMKVMTKVIQEFESELQVVQQQAQCIEEEKRTLRSQLYNVEGSLERHIQDYELYKTHYKRELKNKDKIILDSEQTCILIFKQLCQSETVAESKFQFKDASLPEMLNQIQLMVEELSFASVTSYQHASTALKEANKLRETNSRLQENLQKSTNELHKFTKRMGKGDISGSSLDQSIADLQEKLKEAKLQNEALEKELNEKNRSLCLTNETVNNISAEKCSLRKQIDTFIGALPSNEKCSQEFITSQEKLEYFQKQYTQIVTERTTLSKRCEQLEVNNKKLNECIAVYKREYDPLQEAYSELSTEHETIKKQLITEHQTVTSLQNERVKYLEEKNVLRTIFQQLKVEISRIQQLEGAVLDMSQETNRLSLIAEFNKQLGQQLKNEVEMKENTISELRYNLDKLSHLQVDTDKEKMSLCAQLSQISNVKEKLNECLEMEMKRNQELDERKRELENNTKSKFKVFEEMQKNERAALRELLKDYKGLVKHRDALLKYHEHEKRKIRELERQNIEIHKQCQESLLCINEKDEELKNHKEKLLELEGLLQKSDETNTTHRLKFEKSLKKLEKIISQIRKEKTDVESNNNCLKGELQKLQDQLDETRKSEKASINQLNSTMGESKNIEADLSNYKLQLVNSNQENEKLKLEISFLNKMFEKQSIELQVMAQTSAKNESYLNNKTAMISQEQDVVQLHKTIFDHEYKIKELEQECAQLKKQVADQNKVLIGYEDQLIEYEQQKVAIEGEINKIDSQLREDSNNLTMEKLRYEHLLKQHEELKEAYNKIESSLGAESNCRQSSAIKVMELSGTIQMLEKEKENLRHEIESLVATLDDEKETNLQFATDNNRVHDILEQGKVQYAQLHNNCVAMEQELKEMQYEIDSQKIYIESSEKEKFELNNNLHQTLEELNDTKLNIEDLRNALDDSGKELFNAKQEIFTFQQLLTEQEFKNCELTLQLHEIQGKLETEKSLYHELKTENDMNMKKVLEFEEHILMVETSTNEMEIILPHQMRGYERLIEEINSEYEKSERLKKEIAKEDDKIVALKLSASSCENIISHVTVKIVGDVFEIHDLYDVKRSDLNDLCKFNNDCNFFMVEIVIVKTLLSKLLGSNWQLNVSVLTDQMNISKSVKLENEASLVIIPVRKYIGECTVKSCLYLSTGNDSSVIALKPINIDVSYYFKSVNFMKDKPEDINVQILNILKDYGENLDSSKSQSEMLCDLTTSQFVEAIVKNCYHQLELEAFTNSSENVTNIQFFLFGSKVIMSFDNQTKIVKIKCNASNMHHIKVFLLQFAPELNPEQIKSKLKVLKKNIDEMNVVFQGTSSSP